MMQIRVDRDLCQLHAMCELEAPEVFRAPPTGSVEVLDERPPVALLDAVRAAVRYCPTRALALDETPDDTSSRPGGVST